MTSQDSALTRMLACIRKRPTMYLTQPTISCLRAFLDGWQLAREELGSEHDGTLARFQAWLEKRFDLRPGPNTSWDSIIRFMSANEVEALDVAFELFATFEEKKGDPAFAPDETGIETGGG